MSDRTDFDGSDDIAIVGMAGRFPGAHSVEEFWTNLCRGLESVSVFSDEDLRASGVRPEEWSAPNYVRAGAVLSDIDSFDASFFGMSPREAEFTDPQHRLFLECSWEAIESSGHDVDTFDGRVGVYAGVGFNNYFLANVLTNESLRSSTDPLQVHLRNDKDFLTTFVSYKLNLRGPSVAVQTACSTSLVAVHLACQSLLNGECNMALAGGASVRVPHRVGYRYEEGGIPSPDGHCRAFDAEARGTLFGNGVAIVVLRRLEDAVRDGDFIHAVIKGSAINNDGAVKVGYTAPSVDGQAEVITEALAAGRISADTIGFVEAHGTGTPLGDPIEVAALIQAFRAQTQRRRFCALGSVKTNIGHLDTAAGVAGLIKAALALERRLIPASLHFSRPNPEIDFASSPFFVNTELRPWHAGTTVRRAGVSSFGLGGTNAHVVLEEAPARRSTDDPRSAHLLVLSARSDDALEAATDGLVQHLRANPDLDLCDVAFTLQTGRKAFGKRRALACGDREDAIRSLAARDPKRVFTGIKGAGERAVAFLFSGQGAQYESMTWGLYQESPTFRQQVDECAEIFKAHGGADLRRILCPGAQDRDETATQLIQTQITQPALFIVEYSLVRLLMELGVRPAAMLGHSVGEYVAACVAGVFSLEDGLALIAARGRLMQEVPGGSMLAVALPEEQIGPFLGTELSLAAVNGPSSCVVSGHPDAVTELENRLQSAEVGCRILRTSHAFHSSMMDGAAAAFTEEVRRVRLRAPKIPYVSNVTGTWVQPAEATDPSYWARHLRQTVRFHPGVRELFRRPEWVLLEVGPGRTLSSLVLQHTERLPGQAVLSSVRPASERTSDFSFLLQTLGRLWVAGVRVDWKGLHRGRWHRRVPLPTYAFERRRYWVDPGSPADEMRSRGVVASKTSDLDSWFYAPCWRRAPLRDEGAGTGTSADGGPRRSWLVFVDGGSLGGRIVRTLAEKGQGVTTVTFGERFARRDSSAYVVAPTSAENYHRLIRELVAAGRIPDEVVHVCNVSGDCETSRPLDSLEPSQYLGFYSLLFLAQALGRELPGRPLRLAVLSSDMQCVTGAERVRPERATLLGPCQVMPLEYPDIQCTSVDLVAPPADSWQEASLVTQLMAELGRNPRAAVVAYRGSDRWTRTFEPMGRRGVGGPAITLRDGGTYLITGGLGGIGLVLAEYLAKQARSKLALVGRSRFPAREEWDAWIAAHGDEDEVSRKIGTIRMLERAGSEVAVFSADVSDTAAMSRVLARIEERFGPVHGVVHSAGVPGEEVMQRKTAESAGRVLAPKLLGTAVLDQLLDGAALDFFVICSSLNSVLGAVGQADYCAANAFQDAFAQYRSMRSGAFTVSIAWDRWAEVGMAARAQRPGWTRFLGRQRGEPMKGAPLLDRRVLKSPDGAVYATEFREDSHWTLFEHRISGNSVLPGTAYLEMAREALADWQASGPMEFLEVSFQAPLTVPAGETREVRTVLQRADDGACEFRIASRDATPDGDSREWTEHARGRARRLPLRSTATHDIAEISARCRLETRTFGDEPMAGADHPAVVYGPRWRTLKSVRFGEREALAFLELPDRFASDLTEMELHPALLDVATGIAGANRAGGNYLPFWYKRLQAGGRLAGALVSHVTFHEGEAAKQETLNCDVVIMDDHGRELVRIDEFSMRRVDNLDLFGSIPKPGSPMRSRGLVSDRVPVDPATYRDLLDGPEGTEPSILPAEGQEVLARVLERAWSPQVMVSTRDLPARIEQARRSTGTRIGAEIDASGEPKRLHPRSGVSSPLVSPRSDLEKRFAKVWQELLGIEEVGIDDNFFELGGDSVLGLGVVARLRKLGTEVSPAEMFEWQTIRELADKVSRRSAKDASRPSGVEAAEGGTPRSASEAESKPTLSDFPGAEMSEDELQRLLGRIGHPKDGGENGSAGD